jgi:hypothetical protein
VADEVSMLAGLLMLVASQLACTAESSACSGLAGSSYETKARVAGRGCSDPEKCGHRRALEFRSDGSFREDADDHDIQGTYTCKGETAELDGGPPGPGGAPHRTVTIGAEAGELVVHAVYGDTAFVRSNR